MDTKLVKIYRELGEIARELENQGGNACLSDRLLDAMDTIWICMTDDEREWLNKASKLHGTGTSN
jgi:hypothetical protein